MRRQRLSEGALRGRFEEPAGDGIALDAGTVKPDLSAMLGGAFRRR